MAAGTGGAPAASRAERDGSADPRRPPVQGWEAAAIALILAAQAGALIHLAWRTGVTVDEPSHLLSAHLYWQRRDNLKPRDMPPAIKIAGGWVPGLLGGLPLPVGNKEIMDQHHEWVISLAMMELLRGRVRWMFFCSRLPMLIFPVMTLLLLWWWARQILSPPTAVVLAFLFAAEPTALGHGALFKNDLASTFGYLLFWYLAWRFWRRPDWRGARGLGAGLLAAILTKLSMLILLAIAPAIIAIRYATLRPPRWRAGVAALLLVLLITYVGAVAACQFDTRRLRAEDLAAFAGDPNLPKAFVAAANVFRVLPYPELLFDGAVSILQSNAGGASIHFWGRTVEGGTPLYFLLALAVKMPVSLQILLVAGALLEWLGARRGRFRQERLFWLVPGFLYTGLASLSALQLGVRLVLPALPFGLLLAGNAVETLRRGKFRAVLAFLLALLAFESWRIYPHNISFFNIWAGSPERGAWYLGDSNIDWGQNIRDLAPVIERFRMKKLLLAYFGADDVWSYVSDRIVEPLAPPWTDDLAQGVIYDPKPGYYAVSVSLLPGNRLAPKYRDYFKIFRESTPIARAGYSIYVYRID
jgi:hypothetical protein